jgi:mRNA interferase YafQ
VINLKRLFIKHLHLKLILNNIKKTKKVCDKLTEALSYIANGKQLPENFKNHPLKGEFKGVYDCHLFPNIVLLYSFTNESVSLMRIGSHNKTGITENINNRKVINNSRTKIKTRKFKPNAETIEALEEAERLANSEGKVYHSFEEILEEIFSIKKAANNGGDKMKLTIKESFSNYDIEATLNQIASKCGVDVMEKMLDWLIDHSDNANDIADKLGYYDISEMEYWVGNETIEKVMLNCLETGRVEEI